MSAYIAAPVCPLKHTQSVASGCIKTLTNTSILSYFCPFINIIPPNSPQIPIELVNTFFSFNQEDTVNNGPLAQAANSQ